MVKKTPAKKTKLLTNELVTTGRSQGEEIVIALLRINFPGIKIERNVKSVLGRQELDIPRSLRKILKKWIAVIPEGTDYLFFNNILGPLSNVTLAQRLNKIFGAHKSVNSLRHFYLTKTYSGLMKENEKMADEMGKMGSNISQAKNYVKL